MQSQSSSCIRKRHPLTPSHRQYVSDLCQDVSGRLSEQLLDSNQVLPLLQLPTDSCQICNSRFFLIVSPKPYVAPTRLPIPPATTISLSYSRRYYVYDRGTLFLFHYLYCPLNTIPHSLRLSYRSLRLYAKRSS